MANIPMKTIKFPGLEGTYTIPTAPEHIGAKPADWMPTAEEVGARPADWMPSAEEVGARPDTWMPTAEEVGAAPSGYGLGEYLYTGNAQIVDNFDNATATGWYAYFKQGTTINGVAANGGALEVMAYTAGRIRQIYYPYGSMAVFHRYCYEGVWSGWETDGNHIPAPETANPARFLRNDNTWQTVTPENIGARPNTWMPTVNDLGLQSFSTSYINIPAKSTVRVAIPGVHFIYGRLAGATTTNAVYCITGYATIRAPLITEFSAGTCLAVSSGGDNTNGWYVDFMNTSETTTYLLFCIGTEAPIMK